METLQEPITALPDVPRCPLCGGTMERTTDSQGRTLWLCDACWIWMDDEELDLEGLRAIARCEDGYRSDH